MMRNSIIRRLVLMSWTFLAKKTVVRGFARTTSRVPLRVLCHQPAIPPPQQHCHRLFVSSVTGNVYTADDDVAPKITLFTKEGCTLCDKVKDILKELREEVPHSLEQVDITDEEHKEWFGKYKYDIPVLHVDGKYWLKHRTDQEEARAGLQEAAEGTFEARSGEPNAEGMEHK